MEAGAEIDSKDHGGPIPLSWAAASGQKRILQLLLEEPATDPDLKDNDGRTPLCLAAANG